MCLFKLANISIYLTANALHILFFVIIFACNYLRLRLMVKACYLVLPPIGSRDAWIALPVVLVQCREPNLVNAINCLLLKKQYFLRS